MPGEILAADRKKEEVTQRRDELGATGRRLHRSKYPCIELS